MNALTPVAPRELNAVEGDFLRRFACNPNWTATPKQRAWLIQIAMKIGA